MAESRSGIFEVEKEPGFEFPTDGLDDSSEDVGDWVDESMSASEELYVDSNSNGGNSSEHVSIDVIHVSYFI